jgi:hypothetical protein
MGLVWTERMEILRNGEVFDSVSINLLSKVDSPKTERHLLNSIVTPVSNASVTTRTWKRPGRVVYGGEEVVILQKERFRINIHQSPVETWTYPIRIGICHCTRRTVRIALSIFHFEHHEVASRHRSTPTTRYTQ